MTLKLIIRKWLNDNISMHQIIWYLYKFLLIPYRKSLKHFLNFNDLKQYVDNFGITELSESTSYSQSELLQIIHRYHLEDVFNILQEQGENKQVVQLYYTKQINTSIGVQHRHITRLIEPYSIRKKYNNSQHKSFFYLYQFALDTHHIQAFRFDRIRGQKLLYTKFFPKWDVEINKSLGKL